MREDPYVRVGVPLATALLATLLGLILWLGGACGGDDPDPCDPDCPPPTENPSGN